MQATPNGKVSDSGDGVEAPINTRSYRNCALVCGLMLLGLAPRLSYYLTGRALWFDEAALCINILERSWSGLLDPLAFKQVAPPLYLWSLKLCVEIGGPTVYAVRFPSLVASLMSLILVWSVGKRLLSLQGALLALLMAVVSQHLIVYAGEAKPYASDVAMALGVVYLAIRGEHTCPTWRRLGVWGLILGIMVWYSYAVVFVIAGVGAVQLIWAGLQRDWKSVTRFAAVYGVAACSFLVVYLIAIVPSRGDETTMAYMEHYWRHGFMPFPPTSFWDLRWYRERVFMFFDMPGGFTLQGLALFLWLAGAVAIFTKRKRALFMLLTPLGLTLLASSVKLYPFHGRMTLFLIPVILFSLGEGVAQVGRGYRASVRRTLVALVVLLLLAQPAVRAARMVAAPSRHHELEKVLAYAKQNWQEGDRLYLRQGDYISYRYLESRYDFPAEAVFVERRKEGLEGDEAAFRKEIEPNFAAWGRVWFPMAYDNEGAVADYVAFLDAHGTRFDRHVARGAAVYGFEFRIGSGDRSPT